MAQDIILLLISMDVKSFLWGFCGTVNVQIHYLYSEVVRTLSKPDAFFSTTPYKFSILFLNLAL